MLGTLKYHLFLFYLDINIDVVVHSIANGIAIIIVKMNRYLTSFIGSSTILSSWFILFLSYKITHGTSNPARVDIPIARIDPNNPSGLIKKHNSIPIIPKNMYLFFIYFPPFFKFLMVFKDFVLN